MRDIEDIGFETAAKKLVFPQLLLKMRFGWINTNLLSKQIIEAFEVLEIDQISNL